jgi:hypothetical protein
MVARLRRKQASAYLLEKYGIPRAPGTLAKLASTGGGPPFSPPGLGDHLAIPPHVVEAVLNHSSHKAGIIGVYNRATYEQETQRHCL